MLVYIHYAEQGFNHQKNHVRITNLKSFVKLWIMQRGKVDVMVSEFMKNK